MKKLFFTISTFVARLSLSSAYVGAGFASAGGFHQPKVPKRISK